MRLHRLRVRAFGPFAADTEVDLDALGSNGLFLIHGPTGSGKTSLLDAVCYALYGTVPGARQEARALRSHHADPTVVPLVELELTAGGRRFRIERSPEFSRPKRRGSGTTAVPAKVLLSELVGDEWVDRGSGRHADVGDILKDVIGLDARQFQTVVLLPQGDFAGFLRADTTARVEVLSRLFDTGRFDDIVAWLEQRRRETEGAVKERRADLRLALVRAADALTAVPDDLPALAFRQAELDLFATGTDGRAAPSSGGVVGELRTPAGPLALVGSGSVIDVDACDTAAVRNMLAEAATFVADRARGTRERRAAATASLATARRRLQGAESVVRMRQNAAAAQHELDELASAQPEVDAISERLRRASLASAASGHIAAVDAAVTSHTRAMGEIEDLPEPLARPEGAAGQALSLEAHGEAVATVADLARRFEDEARSADRTRRAVEAAEQSLETIQRELDATREQHSESLEARAAHLANASAEPQLRAVVDQLESVVAVHAAVAVAGTAVLEADEEAARARAAAEAGQRAVGDLLRARASGLAAELAGSLVDGEPCPVCGSGEHPAPTAPGPAGTVSADDVATAEAGLAELLTALASSDARAAAARATRDERAAELERTVGRIATVTEGGPLRLDTDVLLDADGVRSVLDDARRVLAAARASVREVARLDDVLQRVSEVLRRLEQQLVTGREAVAAARAQDATTRATMGSTRSRLLESFDAHATCPCSSPAEDEALNADDAPAALGHAARAMAHRHQGALRAAAHAVEAHRGVERAGVALADARARLDAVLAASELSDVDAAREALLTDADRAGLQRRVEAHDRAVAAAQAILHQEDVIAALVVDEPDLDALMRDEARAAAEANDATEADTLVRRAADQLAAADAAAESVLESLGPALAEAETVREVADTAAGTGASNALRMSLTTFVLAARLEEVVRLANERLSIMTGGRYELRHTDSLAARGRRSGLGLEVVDAWSGTARDTKSLSGGETFMASLALALGLGDAVRAESGGVDLETLFVDEGFGTLDEQALEQVMDVLDGLRAGGRSVGIVSHVQELRTRIPAQVRLTRTESGSTLEVLAEPEPV